MPAQIAQQQALYALFHPRAVAVVGVAVPLQVKRSFAGTALANGSLGRVLASPRWKYPGTGQAFVDLLMSLQSAALSLDSGLQAIDVNPVILGPAGPIAVDALAIASS